jgi:hypothetical protein
MPQCSIIRQPSPPDVADLRKILPSRRAASSDAERNYLLRDRAAYR